MKKHIIFPLFVFLLLVALTACGAQTKKAEEPPVGITKDDTFQVAGASYKLHEIVRVPSIDNGEVTGYGVVVLMGSNKAPVTMSMGSGDTGFTPKSLINMTLDADGNNVYSTVNIAFWANDDGSAFKGCVRFEFGLPKGADFPQKGTFRYTGKNAEMRTLSFIGMEIPE